MAYETLVLERSDPTLKVTLNRPDKLNAMNAKVMQECMDLFAQLREDFDTRFVIFTGAGKAFSAGADLADPTRPKGEEAARHGARLAQQKGHDFIRTLENLEQVTIAAVNGYCLGAGLVLAMGCDFRIASPEAKLGVPEVSVGVFYTWGSTHRLASLVGHSKAKELIMTCDMVDGNEAHRIGLVNQVVPADRLMGACEEMIGKIAGKSPLGIRMTKKLANASAAPNFGDLYICEPELVERLYQSPDAMEGAAAFREKRPPKFKGQ